MATREQAIEILECAKDFKYFCSNYARIADPMRGIIPFKLHDYQEDLADTLQENTRIIILKARQLGISWELCAYSLWLAMFHEAKRILLLSQKEDDAIYLVECATLIYDNLPDWLQRKTTRKSAKKLSFINSSVIEGYSTTEDSGRGRPPSLVVLDEFAMVQGTLGTHLHLGLSGGLAHGGTLCVISTARGYGNEFARIWLGAIRGDNNFKAVFFPWWSFPGRDQAWYDNATSGYLDWMKEQEYPSAWEKAFAQTGRPVFDYDSLALTASITEPMDIDNEENLSEVLGLEYVLKARPINDVSLRHAVLALKKTAGKQSLFIYQPPDKTSCYTIGADVAEGLAHGDNSCATVLDRFTGEEVASWWGKCSTDEFAYILYELTQIYPGVLMPEANNHGKAVVGFLQEWGCPNLYYTKPAWNQNGKRIKDRKAGWETTCGNKYVIIDDLAHALKNGWAKPASRHFLEEAEKFETKDDGKVGAPSSMHDDVVMSWAIAWAGRRELPMISYMSNGKTRQSLKEEKF